MITDSPFAQHVTLVAAVTAAGVEPPKEWTDLHLRFAEFTTATAGAADRLAAAVINGDETADLRIAAVVEALSAAQPQAAASVVNRVRTAVADELRSIYSTVAADTYRAVAERFDAAAAKLTAAADLVDLEAEAGDVVNASAKVRAAWNDAPMLAADLDGLLPGLMAAATLAGAPTGHQPLLLLPLAVDTTNHHRRRLWEAWDSTGRTGRWSALIAEGVIVRAHRDPATLEPYRRPQPMEQCTVTTNGETRVVQVDPEDKGYQPPAPQFAYGRGVFVG